MPDSPSQTVQVVRAIGRWSLIALAINSIIGSGIFGLPSTVAGLLGRASPWAVVAAAVCVGAIIACFAEVSSYFDEAGGPYLYTRAAFGRFAGIQAGWSSWLSQVTAPSANANLFVIYLAEFVPRVKEPWPRFLVLTALIWLLAAVNIAGVAAGARLSNLFTIAKLAPLVLLIVLGLALHPHAPAAAAAPVSAASCLKGILMLFFFYGGFEAAVAPMSEAKDPRKDMPVALFVALGACCLIYALVQWLVVTALPHPAGSERPLADLARLLAGPAGAVFVSVGALLSIYGYLSAKTLAVPRVTLAMASHGDFPDWLAALHSRFRTPYVSILLFAAAVWGFAVGGQFAGNVTLSVVTRVFAYGAVCASVPVLRQKLPGQARFRLPFGMVFPVAGVLISLTLLAQADFKQSLILAVIIVLATVNWLWARARSRASGLSS